MSTGSQRPRLKQEKSLRGTRKKSLRFLPSDSSPPLMTARCLGNRFRARPDACREDALTQSWEKICDEDVMAVSKSNSQTETSIRH